MPEVEYSLIRTERIEQRIRGIERFCSEQTWEICQILLQLLQEIKEIKGESGGANGNTGS